MEKKKQNLGTKEKGQLKKRSQIHIHTALYILQAQDPPRVTKIKLSVSEQGHSGGAEILCIREAWTVSCGMPWAECHPAAGSVRRQTLKMKIKENDPPPILQLDYAY